MINLCHGTSRFNLLIKKSSPQISRTQTITIDMVTQSQSSRRPTCPTCSKPARTCLCTRLQAPRLNNAVKITVLQHSLEQKHPLNSTRIATLGLENIEVFTVSDVNSTVRFLIRLLEYGFEAGRRVGFREDSNVFDEMSERVDSGGDSSVLITTKLHEEVYENGENPAKHSLLNSKTRNHFEEASSLDATIIGGKTIKPTYDSEKKILSGNSEAVSLDFIIGKYGAVNSFSMMPDESMKTSFEQLLTAEVAAKFVTNGFIVKKIQTNTLEGSKESIESDEFEINISRGSVLLFPSENSVSIEDIDFEVKNMIVLDGTWAKAKRMYSENPWLRFLPHVRLDVQKSSLFGEVRHQPKAGYLSTIESIVYALKAADEDGDRLDSLLDVFESMVRAQRDCKNERLGFMSN